MELIDALRRVPLFRNLAEDHLRLVAAICEERTAPPGQRLTRQADLGATLFVVDSGEGIIHRIDEQGHQRPVGMVHPSDSFGVTSLFLGEPRDATVMALIGMHFWTIQRADFEELLAQHPEMQRELNIPQEILTKLTAPRFPWQEPGEIVLSYSRRHWLVLIESMFLTTSAMLMYALLILGLLLFTRVALNVPLLVLPVLPLYALVSVWHWVTWADDYLVVTTRRVTHHEQVAFLYESREEAPLDRVQNINVEHDFWGSLFGYGDLTIETAAQVGRMFFDRVPRPEKISEAIFGQIARVRALRRAVQRQLIHQELATHMNVAVMEPAPEVRPGEESQFDALEELAGPEVQPGRLARAAIWLAETGFFPRTRIETPESITWRKHWAFLLADAAPAFVLGVIGAVLTVLGFLGVPRLFVESFPIYPFIALLITIVAMGWFWWETSDWSNDLYIVTNERIIDTEKRPLFFAEQRREANLGMIQNVSFEIPNLLASVFNYGDVLVQTAGSGEFTFTNVPTPREVQREIFRRMEIYREAQRDQEAARRRAELAEWFSVYDELRRERRPGTSRPPAHDAPDV